MCRSKRSLAELEMNYFKKIIYIPFKSYETFFFVKVNMILILPMTSKKMKFKLHVWNSIYTIFDMNLSTKGKNKVSCDRIRFLFIIISTIFGQNLMISVIVLRRILKPLSKTSKRFCRGNEAHNGAKVFWKYESKVHIFWEGHKILRNLHLAFDWHYIGQK